MQTLEDSEQKAIIDQMAQYLNALFQVMTNQYPVPQVKRIKRAFSLLLSYGIITEDFSQSVSFA